MPGIELRDYQYEAVEKLNTGSILCGGVGSGKSRTALAYYYICNGGSLGTESYEKMKDKPLDLYIITTARKRDTLEWENEMLPFYITKDDNCKMYQHTVVIDSWNNIKKYEKVRGAFFIFDEQHVSGKGAWVKSFLKIARWDEKTKQWPNQWILLSATPGDNWEDYVPVFLANGFFKNRTQFNGDHCVFSPFTNFPKIERYTNTGRLIRLRNQILVNMKFERATVSHHEYVDVPYDLELYRHVVKDRENPFKDDEPIENASEYCYTLRKIVNLDEGRQQAVLDIFENHPKMIVFYNFDAELDVLKALGWGSGVEIAEWNSHKHQPIPDSESWVYLVQYNACEAWNCIKTDTIVFYSMNYSYKTMVQAAGRIDRMNTPFTDLYFYHLRSNAGIDQGIKLALKKKKKFNENAFFMSTEGKYWTGGKQ